MQQDGDQHYRSVWMYLHDLEFRQGFIEAGGIRTRYIEAGPADAPAVIFLHGTAASWESCSANIRAHATRFRTFAIDMIGSGLSDKPDHLYDLDSYVGHVADFMDAMGLARSSFVGVSLGSFVAAKFAQRHPQRTHKVTMVSAVGLPFENNPNIDQAEQGEAVLNAARKRRQAQVENPTWDAMRALLQRLILKPENLVDDLVAVRQAVYRQPAMRTAMENIMDLYEPAVFNRNAITPEQWRRIEAPFLITLSVDVKDWFHETALAIHELLPNSRLLECPGCSHWPQWEMADRFNEANIVFLSEA